MTTLSNGAVRRVRGPPVRCECGCCVCAADVGAGREGGDRVVVQAKYVDAVHGQRLHGLAHHRRHSRALRGRLSRAQRPRRLSTPPSRRRHRRPAGRPPRSQSAFLLDRRAPLCSGTRQSSVICVCDQCVCAWHRRRKSTQKLGCRWRPEMLFLCLRTRWKKHWFLTVDGWVTFSVVEATG